MQKLHTKKNPHNFIPVKRPASHAASNSGSEMSMIRAGQPEGKLALHAATKYEVSSVSFNALDDADRTGTVAWG